MTNHYWDRVSAPHADRDRSEPADRDADNAPSVEERVTRCPGCGRTACRNQRLECDADELVTLGYAEAIRDVVAPDADAAWFAPIDRACVAVEERRTAALRVDNARLRHLLGGLASDVRMPDWQRDLVRAVLADAPTEDGAP